VRYIYKIQYIILNMGGDGAVDKTHAFGVRDTNVSHWQII